MQTTRRTRYETCSGTSKIQSSTSRWCRPWLKFGRRSRSRGNYYLWGTFAHFVTLKTCFFFLPNYPCGTKDTVDRRWFPGLDAREQGSKTYGSVVFEDRLTHGHSYGRRREPGKNSLLGLVGLKRERTIFRRKSYYRVITLPRQQWRNAYLRACFEILVLLSW